MSLPLRITLGTETKERVGKRTTISNTKAMKALTLLGRGTTAIVTTIGNHFKLNSKFE